MNSYIPSYIKTKNRFMIFDLFRTHSTMSRAEIVRITGMSFPTVLKVIDKLLELGILNELEEMEQPAKAGRRGHLLRFNSKAYYAIGIELEGRVANIGLVDFHGNCYHSHKILLSIHQKQAELNNLNTEINNLIEVAKAEAIPVLGIGIGFPAMVNPQEKAILHMAALNIIAPTPFDQVFPAFTSSLTLPYYLENDVNFACKGEVYLRRYNASYQNLLYVTLGSGCGAGIMLDGELWKGSSFKSGEIGNMLVPDYLYDDITNKKPRNYEHTLNLESISKHFQVDLQKEDQLSEELRIKICDYLCPYLSYLFVNLSHLLDIKNGILTGLIPNILGNTLYEKLQTEINRLLTYGSSMQIEPSISQNAGIIGAGITVLEYRLEELFYE